MTTQQRKAIASAIMVNVLIVAVLAALFFAVLLPLVKAAPEDANPKPSVTITADEEGDYFVEWDKWEAQQGYVFVINEQETLMSETDVHILKVPKSLGEESIKVSLLLDDYSKITIFEGTLADAVK